MKINKQTQLDQYFTLQELESMHKLQREGEPCCSSCWEASCKSWRCGYDSGKKAAYSEAALNLLDANDDPDTCFISSTIWEALMSYNGMIRVNGRDGHKTSIGDKTSHNTYKLLVSVFKGENLNTEVKKDEDE